MRRIYKSFALFCALLAIPLMVTAQTTDVTSAFLTNADFDTGATYKFDAPATNLASAAAGVSIHEVVGWSRGGNRE